MNERRYLIIADVDDLIHNYLEPPAVLTMTEVNRHYAQTLADRQLQFNQSKMDFYDMCANGRLWIAKWYEQMIYDLRMHIKQNSPYLAMDQSMCATIKLMEALIHSFQSNNLDMIKWVIGLDARNMYGKIDINETICKRIDNMTYSYYDIFSNACRYGTPEIIDFALQLGGTYSKRIIFAGIEAACKHNAIAVRHLCKSNILTASSNNMDVFVHKACVNGNIEALKTLSQIIFIKPDDLDSYYVFRQACMRNNNLDMLKMMLKLPNVFGTFDIKQLKKDFKKDSYMKRNHPDICEWIKSLK